ncbi:MAG TPA: hypothetical protein PLG59_15250 [bacterium]|nr:hypothetical protein [bacterium]HQO36018.1 hypothetical protein [bacterium]HQQ00281.1 hypothetical protein [bacterium]
MRRIALAAITLALLILSGHYSVLTNALGFPIAAEYAGECESAIFRDNPPNERIIELLIEGEPMGNISFILPVVYDHPVEALARINEFYVGARCRFTRKNDREISMQGKIFFTYMWRNGNRRLGKIEIDKTLEDGIPKKIVGVHLDPPEADAKLTEEVLAALKWRYHLTATIRAPLLAPLVVPVGESK